ncbi:MAG: methyltransferase domain-containing protein [Saprospiraceae bacterium]|nr:methyltransferase domain-containing protein [Saprospiraceae bacterium]
MPNSPLNIEKKAKKIDKISCPGIIEAYQKQFDIDVSTFFDDLNQVEKYECVDTKYQFFYPYDIAGDGHFYEQLQKWEFYYQHWKWEHQVVLDSLKGNEKILEIGCGAAGFLSTLSKKGFEITGLELNKKAVNDGQKKGLDVHFQSIQEHAKENPEKYDIVCSFQVVEHIADVHSFIEASLMSLKPGGLMIISVPNNDSFINLESNTLNLPPHHMGLWTEESLRNLEKIFNIETAQVLFSPLNKEHNSYFEGNLMRSWKRKFRLIPFRIFFLLAKIVKPFLTKKFKGLTIQARFIKK